MLDSLKTSLVILCRYSDRLVLLKFISVVWAELMNDYLLFLLYLSDISSLMHFFFIFVCFKLVVLLKFVSVLSFLTKLVSSSVSSFQGSIFISLILRQVTYCFIISWTTIKAYFYYNKHQHSTHEKHPNIEWRE